MKGGFNKVMRNIAASTADSEFEKVSLHVTSLIVHISLETNKGHFPLGFKRAKREACSL